MAVGASVTSTDAPTIAHSPSKLRRVMLESAVNTAPAVVWRLDHLLQTYAMALGTNAVVSQVRRATPQVRLRNNE